MAIETSKCSYCHIIDDYCLFHSCDFRDYCRDVYHIRDEKGHDPVFCRNCWFTSITWDSQQNLFSDYIDTCMFCVRHMIKEADSLGHETYLRLSDVKRKLLKFDDEPKGEQDSADTFKWNEFIHIKNLRQMLEKIDKYAVNYMSSNKILFPKL